MDQNASTALIFSIVAVVLGALGLVGGVIGYVQGTAALRRASLTRQRASAAEEAALGARAQAEQSARIAQDALDRISRLQLRSLGDVADQPTGPVLLPSRAVAAPPREPFFFEPATIPAPAPAPVQVPEPVSVDPALEAAPQADDPVTAMVPDETSTGQTEQQDAAPIEAAAPEAEPDTTPAPAPPPAPAPVPPQDEPRAPRHATGPIPVGTASTPARVPIVEAPAGEAEPPAPDPAPEESAPVLTESTEAPGEPDGDQAAPARSETGQVAAGGQEAPPMDWAEVLRTGAIPLPARSRGTYAAPAKGKKRASGPARFEVRAVGRQRFEVVNVGAEAAQLVAVEGAGEDRHLVRPVQTRPVTVAAGASLAFSLLRVEGRQVSVQVSWQRNGEAQSAELPLP